MPATLTLTLPHLAVVLVVLLALLGVVEWRGARAWFAVLKPLASFTFLLAGALFLPLPQRHAVLLLVGLVLSLIGDVLLIPKGRKLTFLLGLGAFLVAHLAYCAAFVAAGLAATPALIATAALVAAGVPLARWLLPHVHGAMRPPVISYMLAISAMVALAAGAHGAGARATLLVGAALFYLSDLFVARERFVQRSPVNGAVGLPLYYAAQLLLVDGLR